MSRVTHKNQPAINATGGSVALDGNAIPYTVTKLLWPEQVESWIKSRLIYPTLHVCCGKSKLGDYRVDLYEENCDMNCDASKLPFDDCSFNTVLCDPPYNGKFQWNHDMLSELSRVANKRIIFQHWFLPVNNHGFYKKAHRFRLVDLAVWQPRTYFGRVQAITIVDNTLADNRSLLQSRLYFAKLRSES